MPRIKIDNREVEIEAGKTVLDAARKLGIDIPTLCHADGCEPNTSCLVCLVRVNNGHRLVPSCATKVHDGMSVESETPEIHDARRTALELLLADHAGDCQAPCTNVCPAHMDIPLMIRQIHAGELREALITVKQRIALPAVLGRICPELCEKGCRRGAMDASVSICRLKRYVADVDLASDAPYLPGKDAASGKSVGIIGTGPTGLAAAWYLLQKGHRVVLYDDAELAGGALRYHVGQEKLPWDVLDAEIDMVRRLGAEFRQKVRVGADVSLYELRQQHDAALVAVGELTAPKAQSLGLEMAGKGLKIDKGSMLTSLPGVFAGGAAIMPFKHAIRACADGRSASVAIDQFVRGMEPRAPHSAFTVRLGVLDDVELAQFTHGASPEQRAPGDVLVALTEGRAHGEAGRCLNCDCSKLHSCSLRKWSDAYDAGISTFKMERRPFERVEDHPHVVYESGKCISCGLCVQIAQNEGEPLGLTYVGRGFAIRIGVPMSGALSEALKKVAEKCARACPTAALSMKGQHDLSDERIAASPPRP